MRVFFAGDCHFESRPDPDRLSLFLDFLRGVEEGDILVLTGDIFDFWFEYPGMIQNGHLPLLCAFRELSERAEIVYIPGNHDIWAGKAMETFGPRVRREGVILDLSGKKLLAVHGDMIGNRNRLGRFILGNPFLTLLYSLIHPGVGVPLASWVSRLSRVRSGKKELPPEVMAWMLREMPDDLTCLVAGHFHVPFIHEGGGKILACPGDWLASFTYLVYKDGVLSLARLGGETIAEVRL